MSADYMQKLRKLTAQPLSWTIGATVLFAIYFACLAVRRHSNLVSCEDLALFDQMFWNLRNGNGLVTSLSGEADLLFRHHFFGEHVSPILYLFAWPAGLTSGPEALLVIQALVFALSAIPLALLAGRLFRNGWAGAAAAVFWLLMPNLWLAGLYDFHMEAAEPLFIFAFILALRGGSRWAWLWAVLYAACKEDAPIYLAFVSLIFGWRKHRSLGIKLAACAVIYALLAWFVIGPACSASGSHQLVARALTPGNCGGWRPWISAVFFGTERWEALLRHLLSFGFLPLLGGPAILPAAAAVGAAWLSTSAYQFRMMMHYPFTVYPLLMLSAIWGIGYFLDRLDIYFNVSGKVGPDSLSGRPNGRSAGHRPTPPEQSSELRPSFARRSGLREGGRLDGPALPSEAEKEALKYVLSPRRSLPPLASAKPPPAEPGSRLGIAPLRRDDGRRSLGRITSRLKIFYAAMLIAASTGLVVSWILSWQALRTEIGTGGKDWKNTTAVLAGLPKDGKWAALLQLVAHCARRDDVTVLMKPQDADWLVVRLHGRAYTCPQNEYRQWLAELLRGTNYGVYCRPNDTVAVLKRFHSTNENAKALAEMLWVIEDDDVEHKIGSARKDAEALNGRAWIAGGDDRGAAWYGAYRDLPPGRYLARFRIKAEATGQAPLARLEVVEERGKHVRGALAISSTGGQYVWHKLEADLHGAGGAEWRVIKTGLGTLAIDRVELEPVIRGNVLVSP